MPGGPATASQPTTIGELPPQLAALMQTNINVQALTVEAALTGKREHIYHAAMLDPHTAAELDPGPDLAPGRRPDRRARRLDPAAALGRRRADRAAADRRIVRRARTRRLSARAETAEPLLSAELTKGEETMKRALKVGLLAAGALALSAGAPSARASPRVAPRGRTPPAASPRRRAARWWARTAASPAARGFATDGDGNAAGGGAQALQGSERRRGCAWRRVVALGRRLGEPRERRCGERCQRLGDELGVRRAGTRTATRPRAATPVPSRTRVRPTTARRPTSRAAA